VLGREPLEQRVGVGRVAHRERPELELLPDAVEHDDAAGALEGDEARERVGQLTNVRERAGVQQVVTVEQVQRRVGHISMLRPDGRRVARGARVSPPGCLPQGVSPRETPIVSRLQLLVHRAAARRGALGC